MIAYIPARGGSQTHQKISVISMENQLLAMSFDNIKNLDFLSTSMSRRMITRSADISESFGATVLATQDYTCR